jgi:hypothetical protein
MATVAAAAAAAAAGTGTGTGTGHRTSGAAAAAIDPEEGGGAAAAAAASGAESATAALAGPVGTSGGARAAAAASGTNAAAGAAAAASGTTGVGVSEIRAAQLRMMRALNSAVKTTDGRSHAQRARCTHRRAVPGRRSRRAPPYADAAGLGAVCDERRRASLAPPRSPLSALASPRARARDADPSVCWCAGNGWAQLLGFFANLGYNLLPVRAGSLSYRGRIVERKLVSDVLAF